MEALKKPSITNWMPNKVLPSYSIREKIFFSLYSLGIVISNIVLWVAHFFNAKIRLLYLGRKNTKLSIKNGELKLKGAIWIHCASLGEFEQVRPIIEQLRTKNTTTPMVLSFFSSSGYEVMKHYDKVDKVFYLLSDTPGNAKLLYHAIYPKLFILAKYEYWWNLLDELKNQRVSTLVVSALFMPKDFYFHPMLGVVRDLLRNLDVIFVQDDFSKTLLSDFDINNVIVTGDTRIDSVLLSAGTQRLPEALIEYVKGKSLIVYGSVWYNDMPIVIEMIQQLPYHIHIIVPHDISPASMAIFQNKLQVNHDIYSSGNWKNTIMFVDQIGLLKFLYSKAELAYIGGGFGSGIHNILEPAVYKIPIIFGPKNDRFIEAQQLKDLRVAFEVYKSQDVQKVIELIYENDNMQRISQELEKYFSLHQGATLRVVNKIQTLLH